MDEYTTVDWSWERLLLSSSMLGVCCNCDDTETRWECDDKDDDNGSNGCEIDWCWLLLVLLLLLAILVEEKIDALVELAWIVKPGGGAAIAIVFIVVDIW